MNAPLRGLNFWMGRTLRLASVSCTGVHTAWIVGPLVVWLILAPAFAALASERGPALNWVRLPGAESCVAPVELTELVERRLGRSVFVRARDAIVVIEGRVEPSLPIGFSVVLQVSDPDGTLYGTREIALADADCRKLDEVVSLIIAVTIRHGTGGGGIALPYSVARELDRLFEDESSELDPDSLPRGPSSPPSAAGGVDASAASRGAAGAEARDASGARPESGEPAAYAAGNAFRWDVSTGVGFVSGLQPEFTFGPVISGRVSVAGIGSVGLTLNAGLPKDQTLPGGERGTLEYQAVAARLGICAPSWWVGSSELAGCITGGIGNLHARGRNFGVRNGARDELWGDVGPHVLGRAQVLGPAFVQLSLAAPIRLRTPEFAYTNSAGRAESAFSVARVGLLVEIAVGVRL
jgi:hypothetical protein